MDAREQRLYVRSRLDHGNVPAYGVNCQGVSGPIINLCVCVSSRTQLQIPSMHDAHFGIYVPRRVCSVSTHVRLNYYILTN
jgi:hypothetical protein